MSLSEANLLSVVRKQYLYKLKGFSTSIYGVIILQLLALLFSLSGVGMGSFHTENIWVSIECFSGDMIIGFTIFWVFIKAFWMPARSYRNLDFTLVSNRLSSNLSNIAIILTACLYASVTATLAGGVLRLIVYLTTDHSYILAEGLCMLMSDVLLGIFVTFLYMVLWGSIGYLAGTLTHLNVFSVLLIAVAFLVLVGILGTGHNIGSMVRFYSSESSLILFFLKSFSTSIVLLGLSIVLTNKMEVTR